MKLSSKTLQAIFDYFMITIGSMIAALGIGVFLVDAHVVPGGVTGISMAINFIWDGISVGTLILVLNIPLFMWGVIELGNAFGIRTFYGFVSNSLFIDLFRGELAKGLPIIGGGDAVYEGFGLSLQNLDAVRYMQTHDFFFFMAIGTILIGVGLGLVFKFKGTTAGTEIVCAILKKRFGIKPGVSMLAVDIVVIIVASIVLMLDPKGEIPVLVLTAYALGSLYFQSVILDQVVYGFDYAKSMWIMSNKNDEISKFIMNDLDRGVTAFYARGAYSNTDREVLMTVLSPNDARILAPKVRELDANAFIVIGNVNEVLGEGFRSREEVDVKFINNIRKQEAEQAASEAALKLVRAEREFDEAKAIANQAREHANTLLKNDSDCSEKVTKEAHLNAKLAEEDAKTAHAAFIAAREEAKKLEEVASSIENCLEISDLYDKNTENK